MEGEQSREDEAPYTVLPDTSNATEKVPNFAWMGEASSQGNLFRAAFHVA